MDGMGGMYNQQYGSMDPQSSMDTYTPDRMSSGMGADPMDGSMMGSSQTQTLDQIINQNNQELMRRRIGLQQSPHYRSSSTQDHSRRSSMMEFNPNNSDLADFQFDPNPAHAPPSNQITNNTMSSQNKLNRQQSRSKEDLSLDTRFQTLQQPYDMATSPHYSASIMSNTPVPLDSAAAFLSPNMDPMEFDTMNADVNSMNMHNNANQQSMFSASPVAANFPGSYSSLSNDPGGGSSSGSHSNSQIMGVGQGGGSTPQKLINKPQQALRRSHMMPSPLSMTQGSAMSNMSSPAHMQPSGSRRHSMEGQSGLHNGRPNDLNPSQMTQGPVPPSVSRYQSAYSSTGFDMLGVLMRVATRRKPDINIGPVDLSCAFVVCDIQKHDLPIVYCSDMFERLTGYTKYEILGRNCRFLQAPDGKVQSGTKRRYVDDKSVLYLKNQINKRAEAQLSLINYRKGGQPFMNLLTMIPIAWDTEEFRFFVGFQVDLVEQPNSVSARNPDGTYEINYNRSALPAYQLPQPDQSSGLHELGQSIPRDEVSQVLTTIGNGESELSKRIWDKVLLENTDDIVHVLSLKGLFLYLSPACRKTLEYEPSELVGTALSAVCHPSDIVPVTRELKDSSSGSTVNVVYRIRRKNSGYTWFEAYGCLHTEQGKGRKCIILVGRQRPVYALDKTDITKDGGLGDSELWSKLSTSGMFLFVSSTSRQMLDRLPEDLVGTSVQSLMRPESKKEFLRILEVARTGEKASFKHDLQNRRGQVLQAQTTIYPGDARKGAKPSFLLAQTRLLKMSRSVMQNSQKTGAGTTPRTDPLSASGETPYSQLSGGGASLSTHKQQMPYPGDSGIMTQAGCSGLVVGSQDELLASEDNIFDELKTTRSTSWQFELRQMERQNRLLAEELQTLMSRKKKRKRRKGMGQLEKDCANCHTRVTPEWRRGPSGNRDLCNSCGLRWAKQNGRVSPRGRASVQSDRSSTSPAHVSTMNANGSKQSSAGTTSVTPNSGGRPQSSASAVVPKLERDTSGGSMHPSIDEGQEPPHPNVLPV